MSSPFSEIYEHYSREAYRVAFTYLGDSNMAEDIVQDAYLRIRKKDVSGMDRKARRYYFIKTVINLCRDELRRRGTLSYPAPVNPETIVKLEQKDPEEGPDDVMLKREFIKAVRAASNNLPEQQREAFILYVVEGYSASETARIMESSPALVATWVYRAKKKIQEFLTDWQEWYPGQKK